MLARDCELVAVDLAREYGIDASAVTRIVDRMEKRGLVVRVRSKEDRRVVKLALTAVGTGIAERIPAIFARVQDDLLAGMTSEETGFLLSILGRVLRNGRHVQEHADKASSRVANRLVV
jgi:DNA-binding MarR family transcriptional regulator